MSDEEDIVLSELPDDELVQQMHDDLYDGLKEEIEEGTNILLGRGWTPYKVLTEALVEGMRIVGEDFRDGILFVPEVLLVSQRHEGGHVLSCAHCLAETGAPKVGTMVVGTVKGDIHDIGKNLVGMMLEGAGFEDRRHRHQQSGRELPRSHRRAQTGNPRYVRAAHDHDALHESRDRHVG